MHLWQGSKLVWFYFILIEFNQSIQQEITATLQYIRRSHVTISNARQKYILREYNIITIKEVFKCLLLRLSNSVFGNGLFVLIKNPNIVLIDKKNVVILTNLFSNTRVQKKATFECGKLCDLVNCEFSRIIRDNRDFNKFRDWHKIFSSSYR